MAYYSCGNLCRSVTNCPDGRSKTAYAVLLRPVAAKQNALLRSGMEICMSRIKEAFENGKAFIAFVTCGDPDLETTGAVVREMVKNGADLIELGIPFSDPTAEGPVIQGANLRALNGGVTTDQIFES